MDETTIYVLMSDDDMTTFSSPKPIGVAVRDEENAKAWVAHYKAARAYVPVRVVETVSPQECGTL